ncbi:MAG TPA: family 43 glycosylhydrolase [Herpetosiphonaceae bacterium]
MQRGIVRQQLPRPLVYLLVLLLIVGVASAAPVTTAQVRPAAATYTNPLTVQIPTDGLVESCADPSVIRGQQDGDNYWYMYCTTDPLNDEDKTGADFNFHLVPMFRSLDLVSWTYMGDAFTRDASGSIPNLSWAAPFAGVWAPEIDFFDGKYYLYYGITDVTDATSGEPNCGGDNAIGVATSSSPLGPWTDLGRPVVEPRRAGPGCNFFWTFDPEVIEAPPVDEYSDPQKYIYYGSYYGGIFVRELSADGFTAPADTAKQVTIANRYEGAEVVLHDGYYYLFVSASNCCNGPQTGYSVFAGRSVDPTGPFVDREGVSLHPEADATPNGRVGGTPVLSLNGNRWVGPGHNTVFTDFDGQDWTIYHAIDQNDPYFAGTDSFTKRPVLLDALDWIDGWPTVRGGQWISDTPQQGPAAQPGDTTNYRQPPAPNDELGRQLTDYSDEFNSLMLSPQWSWVREPAAGTFGLEDNTFRFDTQAADLYQTNNSASILSQAAPNSNYVVETRMKLDLPAAGCCFNYTQAGLLIYADDDRYVRLVHVSIWETRQTEFAREYVHPTKGPFYGSTLVGPPDEWTYLRIVRRAQSGGELYTAYTSRDGTNWVRGGTWNHDLGQNARIGLVSMGSPNNGDFTANFDYVRVYQLIGSRIWMPMLSQPQ